MYLTPFRILPVFMYEKENNWIQIEGSRSIDANINEANYGQSKADFLSKMHIALKETAETEYWLKLLTISEYITEYMGKSLLNDCLDIKRILIASINTAKENK